MLYFKELEQEVVHLQERLADLSSTPDLLDKQRLKLLLRIVVYVRSFYWLRNKLIMQKVRAFLRSRYSYEVARDFGVSKSSFHVTVSYAANRLRSKVGSRTLDLIREGRIAEAESEFMLCSGQIDLARLLAVKGFGEGFFPSLNTSLTLAECESELRLLRDYSAYALHRRVAAADARKLGHLLALLSSADARYSVERGLLHRLLVGELDVADVVVAEKSEYIYAGLT